MKRGYNVLCTKVVEGPTPMQYRKAWGVRALAFILSGSGGGL